MKSSTSLAVLTAAALLAACGTLGSTGPKAIATLEPTKGNTAAGTVTFQQKGDRVMVTANVTGLPPNSEHGFHAHEKGDCSSGDGMSTGGHFNPNGKPHGPLSADHHAGDMPNIVSPPAGAHTVQFLLDGVKLTGRGGLLDDDGASIVIHSSEDDHLTDPSGNSAARYACGVITLGIVMMLQPFAMFLYTY